MATVNFRIKGKADPSSIYIRLKNGRDIDLEVSTDIKVPKKYWSSAKGAAKVVADYDYKTTNTKLKQLESYIIDQFNADNTNGAIINNVWLKEKINILFNRPNNNDKDSEVYIIQFIDKFIEYSKRRKTKKGTPVAKRTIQHYGTTKNKLLAYEKHKNIRLKLIDINLKFHSNFEEFLEYEQMLNPNTIGGYFEDIKLFCRRAEKKGIPVNLEYKDEDFYIPSNDTHDIYLTVSEINQIRDYKFNTDYLDNARDWFIIGLWTGLRISDFLKLTPNDIEDDFIQVETFKTGYPVIIPIHEQIQQIINKRNGNFPRQISDQNFNKYIKEVCKKVGIDELVEGSKMVAVKNPAGEEQYRKVKDKYPKYELVTSHICRRSFATNHYSKIDTLTIMKITGHRTEKQFLEYIKITPKQYAEKLKAYWREQKRLKNLDQPTETVNAVI
ncbi:MAG: site-specific integrase [Flavobacteriales bacterium]|nr:site-specific integrase [Flavobacteriales bacterium]